MNIEAFILIGGKSSRFGRDKATTNFAGATLVERTSATVRQAFSTSHITLVAANENQFASKFATGNGYAVIFDQYKNRGPIGAVHAALSFAQTDWALALACDFPFISTELLKRLAGIISHDIDAVTPIQSDGKIQPLCSVYRVKPCMNVMKRILETEADTPPLHRLFEHVRTRFVSFDELNDLPNAQIFFLNVNTPEDFQFATELTSPQRHKGHKVK